MKPSRQLKICLLIILVFVFSSPFFAHAATIQAAPTKGLVGYWSFDYFTMGTTSALDLSGKGNTGWMIGGVTKVAGKLGRGVSFDGSSGNIGISNQERFNLYPMSVSVWTKFGNQGSEQQPALVSKYAKSSLNGWQLFIDNANASSNQQSLCFWYFKDSGNYIYDGSNYCTMRTNGYNDNKWHNVVVTVDSSGGKLYVDGVYKATQGWTGTPGVDTSTVSPSIGYYNYKTGGSYLNGSVDDVRIYNRALSYAEVRALYASRGATTVTTLTAPSSYSYSKKVNISNTASQSDYPVKLVLDTASLVSARKMRSDCKDLVFRDSDGETALNYWLESGCNTSSTIVWVKIPSLTNGTVTAYMYYGNPNETTTYSSGESVFPFFDDFLGTSIDGAKWPRVQGTFNVSDGVLSASSAGQIYISSNISYGGIGYAYRTNFSMSNTVGDVNNSVGFVNAQTGWTKSFSTEHYSNNSKFGGYSVGATGRWFGTVAYSSGYHVHEGKRLSRNSQKYYVDDVLNGTLSDGDTGWVSGILIYAYSNAIPGVDWVLIRPTQDSEPTYSFNQEERKRVITVNASRANIPATATTNLSSGLVGYWTFDGTNMGTTQAYDLSGNNNTGTLAGGVKKVIGKIGQALKFDGGSGYVETAASAGQAMGGTGPFSISSWVKTSQTTPGSIVRLNTTDLGALMVSWTSLDAAALHKATFGRQKSTSIWNWVNSSVNIDDNKWHFLTGIYDGTSIYIYVDGVNRGQTSQPSAKTFGASASWLIGRHYTGVENYNGSVDDVRLYNRALSASEVLKLYRMGR